MSRLCDFFKYYKYYADKYNLIKLKDEQFLKILYKKTFGRDLNLDNPKRFNEKLQWLKLYDRNPKYTKMVDKYEAKKYVASIIGDKYIIPTLGIYDEFNQINFEKLPDQFVIKCTHDSGGLVICKDKAKLDIKKSKKIINKSLKRNYYYPGREWPYKNVKPRIIIEKYMEEKNYSQLNDYKFMCFNGKVNCSFVCSERDNKKEGLAVTFFDINWEKMPFKRHYRNSIKKIDKPKNYDLMIKLAEQLSENIPFVRVDFYEIDGKVYFGELTFYPGSGLEEFEPDYLDEKLGNLIDLSLVKNNEK